MFGQSNLVDNRWGTYLQPSIVVLMPNLFFAGAIMFALAALGRNMTWVYLSAALLLAANMSAGVAMRDVEAAPIATILEPFGSMAFVELAEHLTVQQRDAELVPLTHLLIINRTVWTGIGLLVLGVTVL